MKQNKGFTLIELLVVIAIIGILSSIVLASLNDARNKGADSTIKADLSGVRANAELEFDALIGKYGPTSGNTVAGNCSRTDTGTIYANPNIQKALAHIRATNGNQAGQCQIAANGTSYAIAFPLKTSGTYWCIDSNGIARGKVTAGTPYAALTGATGAITVTNSNCN